MEPWKEKARAKATGEKLTLKSLDGEFWVKPKLYSVMHAAEIQGLAIEMARGSAGVMKKYRKIKTVDDISKMKDDDVETLMEVSGGVSPDMLKKSAERTRLILLYGIDNQNLTEKGGPFSEQQVEELMEIPTVANEITAIVEVFNRPLSHKTGKT